MEFRTDLATSIPSGNEIYDQLMQGIEPDLVTDQLPLLAEKYKGETPEETTARSERYAQAFAEYQKQFTVFTSDWDTKLRYNVSAIRVDQEQQTQASDEQQFGNLDDAISSL